MGNSLSPVVSNTFAEHFEEITLDTAEHTSIKWLRYVDDTSVASPHGSTRLQQNPNHLNSLTPTNEFRMEVEDNHILPFLDVSVMRKGHKMAREVYREPTNTCRYLQ